jgi:hypothetical protein
MHDPLLSLRLDCSRGVRRKLEHCRFLILKHLGEEQGLPVRKFERIMMYVRVVLVHLPEDGRRMSNDTILPIKEPAWAEHYHPLEGKLRSRQNANRRVGIFRRSESASTGIEIAGGEFIANLGRTRLYVVQAVIAHAEDLLCCLQPQPTKFRNRPRELLPTAAISGHGRAVKSIPVDWEPRRSKWNLCELWQLGWVTSDLDHRHNAIVGAVIVLDLGQLPGA